MDFNDSHLKGQHYTDKSITFGESLGKNYEVWKSHRILYLLSFGDGNQRKCDPLNT